jgi:hypothetical protein
MIVRFHWIQKWLSVCCRLCIAATGPVDLQGYSAEYFKFLLRIIAPVIYNHISAQMWVVISQNRYQTKRDTPMCFGWRKTSEIFFTCYDAILECTRHFVPMFSYEKLPCALQDGVIWWRIFTSALVKFRTKYRLSDTSGPVSILWLYLGLNGPHFMRIISQVTLNISWVMQIDLHNRWRIMQIN